ncbi:hypothetical protein CR513_60724, partial [Mucuna pruriens]
MEFVVSLLRTIGGVCSIWVIVDKLTKCAHFLSINIKLHGVLLSIVSDKNPRFTSYFWQSLYKALRTRLKLSLAYHLLMNEQSKRWDEVLLLVKFT